MCKGFRGVGRVPLLVKGVSRAPLSPFTDFLVEFWKVCLVQSLIRSKNRSFSWLNQKSQIKRARSINSLWNSRVSWPSENKQQQQKLAGKCTFLSIKNSLSRDRKSILTLEQFEHLSKACYCSWPLFRVCSISNSLRYSDRRYFACVTGRDVHVELFLEAVSLVRIKF